MQGKHFDGSLKFQLLGIEFTCLDMNSCLVQVFWPLDADWYSGGVVGYNAETHRHRVCLSYPF